MIPFIDLKGQYAKIEENVDKAIKKVLMHGQYILGPEVAELENSLLNLPEQNIVLPAPAELTLSSWQ